MKKILLLVLTLLGASFGLHARGQQMPETAEQTPAAVTESESPVHIRMAALKGPTAFGMIRMIDQTESIGSQITLSYELVATPQDMVARISSGQVDIAALPVTLAAKLYNKMGSKGYALGAAVGDGVLYGLTTDSDEVSWATFRGGTLNTIAQGSTPDYLTRYILNKRGLDAGKDVTLNFTYTHQQLAQLMAAGKVDNAILPEPLATMVLMKNPDARIFSDMQNEWSELSGTGRNYPISLAVVAPGLTDTGVLDAVFSAYRSSVEWAVSHPEDAAAAIEKHGIMPAAMALQAIPRCNLNFRKPVDVRSDLVLFYDVLAGFDPAAVGGKLPDEKFYLTY